MELNYKSPSLPTAHASTSNAQPRHVFKHIFGTLLLSVLMAVSANAATITWDNGGGDGLWSSAANWSGNVLPGTADDVVFDATSVANCTIDGNYSIKSINIAVAYTGIVSLGSNTLAIGGNVTVASAAAFDAGTGKVKLTATSTFNSAAPMPDMEIASGTGSVTFTQNALVNDSLVITSVGSMASSEIRVSGNVVINDAWTSTTTVSLVGATDQTIAGTGVMTYFEYAKPTGNALFDAAFNKTFSNANVTAGTWNTFSQTFTLTV